MSATPTLIAIARDHMGCKSNWTFNRPDDFSDAAVIAAIRQLVTKSIKKHTNNPPRVILVEINGGKP